MIEERLTFFAALYKIGENQDQTQLGMWLLYGTIVLLSILVYNLGFARKLPLLKNVVVYISLALGCTVLTFFAVFLPVAEGLIVAAMFLGIYKFRRHRRQDEQHAEQGS
ncbi:YlaH-like family protein [Peribacillus saganii]|uniref:YlaH-like family protein n=1 Tax=Peribacillus saganii TaxID=2303992 RepID=UPI00268D3348